jgi:hypothetical protein
LLGGIDLPAVGRLLLRKYSPSECYDFWEHHARGFRRPCRDLTAADVTNKVKETVRAALAQVPTRARNRLLIKITGWPRLGYLHEIFPDARFLHIVRDGRAVVNSLVNVDWWWGWGGPEKWRLGELTPAQRSLWEKHNRSFIALAGLQWNILLEAMDAARQSIPKEAFLEIRYEDLCARPMPVLREALDFLELDWNPVFESRLRHHDLRSSNFKWQEELTPDQHRIMEDVMRKHLTRYGYLDAGGSPQAAPRPGSDKVESLAQS